MKNLKTQQKLNIITTALIVLNAVLAVLSTAFYILAPLIIFISFIPIILSIISIRIKRNTWGTVLLVISILILIIFVL